MKPKFKGNYAKYIGELKQQIKELKEMLNDYYTQGYYEFDSEFIDKVKQALKK
jgi:hypothetical protein